MSAEDVQKENRLYERLTLALTGSPTELSSEDLTKWGLRSALFTNVDQQIDAVIESARGREQIARHHLCVLAFKIVNRLLAPIDAGETDRQYQKRMLSRIATANHTNQRKTPSGNSAVTLFPPSRNRRGLPSPLI